MLIHQQHVSSEYKVRGGNGNVLITLETGVERDIRNYNMIDIKHHMHVIVWLAKSKIKFRNVKNKLVKKELLLCFIIKTASRPSKIRIVNKKIYFVILLLERPTDNIVIVWTAVIPVHHCQL